MGLVTKPPNWAYCSTNIASSTTGDIGTTFTAGASNVDGTAVTLLSALAHDVEYLEIGVEGINVSGAVSDALLDILVDPSGGTSWQSLIDDLLVGYSPAVANGVAEGRSFSFPIWIPAGTSVGARARTRRASSIATGSVYVAAYGGNANPGSWWCGQRVTSIGIDGTISGGVSHTPGVGVFSTWTNFGSTLAANCGALQFALQADNQSILNNFVGQFEFGVSSTRIGLPLRYAASNAETLAISRTGLTFASLPSGTQLQARGRQDTGTGNAMQVAAYAVH